MSSSSRSPRATAAAHGLCASCATAHHHHHHHHRSFASSSASAFSAHPLPFITHHHHHHQHHRVQLAPAPSLRLLHHHRNHRPQIVSHPHARRACACSPTTHPGSFRCALHRSAGTVPASAPPNRLNSRRSAMTNSLVRIGTVEGEWVRRALAALIRPSSHHQRRRADFRPRPSRLSVMSRAGDDDDVVRA